MKVEIDLKKYENLEELFKEYKDIVLKEIEKDKILKEKEENE